MKKAWEMPKLKSVEITNVTFGGREGSPDGHGGDRLLS